MTWEFRCLTFLAGIANGKISRYSSDGGNFSSLGVFDFQFLGVTLAQLVDFPGTRLSSFSPAHTRPPLVILEQGTADFIAPSSQGSDSFARFGEPVVCC